MSASAGRTMRLDILERDAQEPILGLLRTHGWNAAIERRGSDADYLIISATRAGRTQRVAVLYSSSTDRKVYSRLAAQVDAILANHGVDPRDVPEGLAIPVLGRDDFFTVVLAWNAEVCPDKIAPDAGAPPAVRLSKGRRIQAEMPLESIWTRLRQLGSVTLARRLVEARMAAAGIEPAREVVEPKAEGLAYAVRNATDYLRHADRQNLSQRILTLYYGTVSFAMAELLAAPNGAGTLDEVESATKRGHGLYTVDGPVAAFDALIVGAVASGFFPTWMAFLGKTTAAYPKSSKKPSDYGELEAVPAETHVSLAGLFARIPEVADLFDDVFPDEPPAWFEPHYASGANPTILRATPAALGIRKSYIELLDRSGKSTIEGAAQLAGPLSQLAHIHNAKEPGLRIRALVTHPDHEYWQDTLPLHRSPYVDRAIILPLFGDVTEYRAINLVLLYALSIIVRYRPSIWRRVQEGDQDQYRNLIEAHLDIAERVLPEEFLATITDQPIHAVQTGSMW